MGGIPNSAWVIIESSATIRFHAPKVPLDKRVECIVRDKVLVCHQMLNLSKRHPAIKVRIGFRHIAVFYVEFDINHVLTMPGKSTSWGGVHSGPTCQQICCGLTASRVTTFVATAAKVGRIPRAILVVVILTIDHGGSAMLVIVMCSRTNNAAHSLVVTLCWVLTTMPIRCDLFHNAYL